MEIRHPLSQTTTRKIREHQAALRNGELSFFDDKDMYALQSLSPEEKNRYTFQNVSLVHTAHYLKFMFGNKSLTLSKIQQEYFAILRAYFWDHYLTMQKRGLNEQTYTVDRLNDPIFRSQFEVVLAELALKILEFWDTYGTATKFLLAQQKSMKCSFGGDMFPSYTTNIASQVGVYVDTIVLPDPLLRVTNFVQGNVPSHHALYFVLKHALNALKYEELATTEKCDPIVCIAPDLMYYDMASEEFIGQNAVNDTLYYFRDVFRNSFDTFDDLMAFAKTLDTIGEIVNQARFPRKLILKVEQANLPIKEQLEQIISKSLADTPKIAQVSPTPGTLVVHNVFGRMAQANEMLYKSGLYGGSPLADAPTSWHFLQQKLLYDSERVCGMADSFKDQAIVQALVNDQQIAAFRDLPNEALIQLREENAVAELRRIVRDGIDELEEVTPSQFRATAQQVATNIKSAIVRYNADLDEYQKGKKSLIFSDIPRFLVVGGLSVAAVLTGNIAFAAAAALGRLIGLPSIPELVLKGDKIIRAERNLKYSPISILKKDYI